MLWFQKQIDLKPRPRGFHLITEEILEQLPEIEQLSVGVLNLFLQHTSASLTVNENADPDVRRDFESYFNQLAPERAAYFRHTTEGPDDMPSHLKSSLLGTSVILPVASGRLALGVWQGIYLCEHRNNGGTRSVIATLQGERVLKKH